MTRAEDILVRPAVKDDAPGMARVVVDTVRVAFRDLVPEGAGWLTNSRPLNDLYAESERNWRRALGEIAAAPARREQAFVATDAADGGRVVGVAMGGPRRLPAPTFGAYAGEVYILLVLPTHQRRGTGRRLIQAVFRHLLAAGTSSAVVEGLSANTPACRFYEALDGRLAGESTIDEDGTLLPGTVYGWPALDDLHA